MQANFRLTLHARIADLPQDDVPAYQACVKDIFQTVDLAPQSHNQFLDDIMQGQRACCPSHKPRAEDCAALIPDPTPSN